MANQNIVAEKAAKVADITQRMSKAQSIVFFNYRGLTVEEDTNLRNQFRAAGVEYAVLKNAMIERSADTLGIDASVKKYLAGPTAVAFGIKDPVAPAKIAKDFIKKAKKCEIKGGIVNGKVIDAKGVEALAELPSREVLIARILGSMNAPITSLAIALKAIKEQKENPAAAE